MKTFAPFAKAIVAIVFATAGAASLKAGGPDLSVLTAGDWMAALGAGLASGGVVYGTPNKSGAPDLTPTEIVANTVQAVVDAKSQAQADYDSVTKVLGGIAGQIPVYGDEAKAVIDSLPRF